MREAAFWGLLFDLRFRDTVGPSTAKRKQAISWRVAAATTFSVHKAVKIFFAALHCGQGHGLLNDGVYISAPTSTI